MNKPSTLFSTISFVKDAAHTKHRAQCAWMNWATLSSMLDIRVRSSWQVCKLKHARSPKLHPQKIKPWNNIWTVTSWSRLEHFMAWMTEKWSILDRFITIRQDEHVPLFQSSRLWVSILISMIYYHHHSLLQHHSEGLLLPKLSGQDVSSCRRDDLSLRTDSRKVLAWRFLNRHN